MTTRLLCVGDIHLGRRPSRVPRELAIPLESLGPEVAWDATVKAALERRVHAVLLAGDVVERIEDRFRAFAALQRGVQRLRGAGVEVLAVVGNHDVEALPLLAERVDGVRLLGMGESRWERARVEGDGGQVDVWGWSFRAKVEKVSPVESFPRERARDGKAITLGLLHCELDGNDDRYAPVKRSALVNTALDAWLLGHVHRPHALSSKDPIGYLGSISAYDPGESGPHGPWLLEVGNDGELRFEHLPVAPIRYEAFDFNVEDLPREGDLATGLAAAIERGRLSAWIASDATLAEVKVLALRITLTGATDRAAEIRTAAETLREQQLKVAGPTTFVETFVDAMRPALDLTALAADTGYRGLVARRLLSLEQGDADARALVQQARERLDRELASHGPWRALDPDREPLDDDQLRRRLASAARRTLEELENQRRGGAA
jgi:exonuclease SbcD